MGAENIAPTEIRSPDRTARSKSLYQLSYPSLQEIIYMYKMERNVTSLSLITEYNECNAERKVLGHEGIGLQEVTELQVHSFALLALRDGKVNEW
jgi:hypothetical protein